jgi:spore coat protein U-like protein
VYNTTDGLSGTLVINSNGPYSVVMSSTNTGWIMVDDNAAQSHLGYTAKLVASGATTINSTDATPVSQMATSAGGFSWGFTVTPASTNPDGAQITPGTYTDTVTFTITPAA